MGPDARIETTAWRAHALRNRVLSALLVLAMAGFLALLGWLLWGESGLIVLLSACVATLLVQPLLSPGLVMRLQGARPVDPREAPRLAAMLDELAARAGLPAAPRLHYLPSRTANAFTVGAPDDAAIAVTEGLLRALDARELAGVLAHEVSHVRNRDPWVMTLADMFGRLTGLLALFGAVLLLVNLPLLLFAQVTVDWVAVALLLLAPQLSGLAQLALARTREYDADLNAVRLTGDPDGLARALDKIDRARGGFWRRWLFPGYRDPVPPVLRTHPETASRIARLRELRKAERASPFGRLRPVVLPGVRRAPFLFPGEPWR